MELLFATQNKNKAIEISRILGHQIQLTTLTEAGITCELAETGETLRENALQKAEQAFSLTGKNCFADDTGLEVFSLNSAPGVYSARYAGLQKNDADNINLLLKNLENHSNRSACFKTVICLFLNQQYYFFEGVLKGTISKLPAGNGGFGYDPIFIPEGYTKTLAQLTLDEKNAISHRAKAFEAMRQFLQKVLK